MSFSHVLNHRLRRVSFDVDPVLYQVIQQYASKEQLSVRAYVKREFLKSWERMAPQRAIPIPESRSTD